MLIHIVLCVSIFSRLIRIDPIPLMSFSWLPRRVILVAASVEEISLWVKFGLCLEFVRQFQKETYRNMINNDEAPRVWDIHPYPSISIHISYIHPYIRPYIWWIISQTSPICYKDMFVGARASARRTAVMRPGACRNHQRRAAVGWELLQERFGPGGNPKCWDLVSSSGDFESGVILGGNMLKSSSTFFSVQVFTQDRCCKWCKMYIKSNNVYNKCKDNWWRWKTYRQKNIYSV